MARKGWLVNLEGCIGCQACTIACKARHGDPETPTILRRFAAGVPHVATAEYFVPMSCNHCEDAACIAACPNGALRKDAETGIVLQDLDKCVGCRRCQWACPYGAIQYRSDTGKVTKCDMCYDRQIEGLEPACVQACPGETLHIVDGFDIAESGEGAPPSFADKAWTSPAIKFTGVPLT